MSKPELIADINTTGSAKLFEAACRIIPGGVNSTARATWSGWTPYPLFVQSGQGSRLRDVDGNEYIDYLLGLGPMIFGHRPPRVTQAVVDFIQQRGTVFALPTADEARLAEKIIAAVPSVEQVRLCNTGTGRLSGPALSMFGCLLQYTPSEKPWYMPSKRMILLRLVKARARRVA